VQTVCIASAHHHDGMRFIVHDDKLTAFLELESTIQAYRE
jgi:hypothetical protein